MLSPPWELSDGSHPSQENLGKGFETVKRLARFAPRLVFN